MRQQQLPVALVVAELQQDVEFARAIYFAVVDVQGDSTSEQPYLGTAVRHRALCTCSGDKRHG